MHHFPKKSRKVDALLHLFPIDSPRTLQLLFSFSGFSLPAIFLLQLLFNYLRFFSARRSAAANAKRSGWRLRHLPSHSRPFLRPQKRSDQREAQRPAPHTQNLFTISLSIFMSIGVSLVSSVYIRLSPGIYPFFW